MAVVKIADIIVPQVFDPYVAKKTMELSGLVTAGIIANDAHFDQLASSAGTNVKMPYFTDLVGDAEPMLEDTTLTPGGIGTAQDQAVIIRRARMWGANNLAGALAGKNPATVIADLTASYWARQMQAELLAILAGVFGAASMSGLVHDISGGAGAAAVWSAAAFLDANQKLGDAKGILTAVAVHSAVHSLLRKQNLITSVIPSDGGPAVDYYDGKRVIVDDGCPLSAGVYTSYLFGAGAVALGNGSPAGIVGTETSRNASNAAGEDYLTNRKTFILHPRGVAFTGTPAATETPTRAELATGTNWVRKYDVKQLRIVALMTKIA